MAIYTKTGDEGETGLIGGLRLGKNNPIFQVLGDLDEFSASLGIAISNSADPEIKILLANVQKKIFSIGAEIANPKGAKVGDFQPVSFKDVSSLENIIDELSKELVPLTDFILPGGTDEAAHLHLCRAICRRCERNLVAIHKSKKQEAAFLAYLNRLSDFLFTVARIVNKRAGISDTTWR